MSDEDHSPDVGCHRRRRGGCGRHGRTEVATGPALATARASTARFHQLTEAEAAGYGLSPAGVPLHECVASFDDTGAVGFHYINGALLDTTLNPTQPEALVYAPNANGRLRLVAVEYVVFQEPWIAEHGDEMPLALRSGVHARRIPESI